MLQIYEVAKVQVTRYKLHVTSYKFKAKSCTLHVTSYTLQVTRYKLHEVPAAGDGSAAVQPHGLAS